MNVDEVLVPHPVAAPHGFNELSPAERDARVSRQDDEEVPFGRRQGDWRALQVDLLPCRVDAQVAEYPGRFGQLGTDGPVGARSAQHRLRRASDSRPARGRRRSCRRASLHPQRRGSVRPAQGMTCSRHQSARLRDARPDPVAGGRQSSSNLNPVTTCSRAAWRSLGAVDTAVFDDFPEGDL